MKEKQETALQYILNKVTDEKKVFGSSFCVRYKNETWCGSAGNLNYNSPYFIASTTKLFTTAVILNLRSKGLLDLDNKITRYAGQEVTYGLHQYKGTDCSGEITIRHLLSHTSGLPDYFEDQSGSTSSLKNQLLFGKDRSWSFEELIERSKSIPPLFRPGEKGKAHYSDTNFQLLGKIIETTTGKTLSENYQDIVFKPLGLTQTYLYQDALNHHPTMFYYKNRKLSIPQAIISAKADGGIVSTSLDMVTFLEGFFEGKLFPENYINELRQWNKIFYPFQAGTGIHRFKFMWIMDPFGTISELLGHSGLSGALAYHNPRNHLYIAGTVNQVAYPSTSLRTAIKLIQKVLGK